MHLVPCRCPSQALWVQLLGVWLPGGRSKPVPWHAKVASEPGSQETRLKSVSPKPGS